MTATMIPFFDDFGASLEGSQLATRQPRHAQVEWKEWPHGRGMTFSGVAPAGSISKQMAHSRSELIFKEPAKLVTTGRENGTMFLFLARM